MTQTAPQTSVKPDDYLRQILQPGEAMRIGIHGTVRYSSLIEIIPIFGKFAQLARRGHVAVLTSQRLIVMELTKFAGNVKSSTAYNLADVAAVSTQVHMLSSSVSISAGGRAYLLRDVGKQAGQDFQAHFAAIRSR
jgi:hypothetical protein